MSDRFSSFEELSKEYAKGVDFSIRSRPVEGSNLLVMAPHGGKIEPLTSELAARVAGANHSLYLFEGCMKSKNRDLHITSHAFFEPALDSLLNEHRRAMAFHGRRDDGDLETIFLGGLDKALISSISTALRDVGFEVSSEGHKFPGSHRTNTCNRCSSGKGVQFELPTSLRNMLKADQGLLEVLVIAIRDVMETELK
ncbi:Phage-related replication protein YjqB, UPF0714/DUF867 family [Sulfitobacter brevis]|uniref:Phage-related replication protein YjqB, UPF0714/DUF867 family n=1 Tax=Sulfitobacter brevis TaxID=74348 RepID=A0A1I2F2A3_9RHOB|nr:poly-gamma-glutamate hydrolase family protein [Sulfitobacter brevis]SFE98640.1 Phage-related replication protein YjqB, UPF0714/DUF867 family [Sulfitobacter brevis]